MDSEPAFDVSFARSHFPALESPWALFDNAGGSVPPRQVIRLVSEHLQRLPVQLGASYALSREAGSAVQRGREAAATFLGAEAGEIVLGASTTSLLTVLSRALRPLWRKGDEVVVTNLDHEANVGPWRALERTGMEVKEWRFREDTLRLDPADLEPLLTDRTRLVAFTHCSNLFGSIQDVPAIADLCREKGILSCVDGVAYAPHRRVDVAAFGVDFYAVSLYKTLGPHIAALFGRRELLEEMGGCNHRFIEDLPGKLEPGNVPYELAAGIPGILEYHDVIDRHHFAKVELDPAHQLERTYELLVDHERALVRPLLELLDRRSGVTLLGEANADSATRVPTVSFHVEGRDSSEIPPLLDEHHLATRYGHFYSPGPVEALGLMDKAGVVRLSLAHYNDAGEVERLAEALDEILPGKK